MSLPLYLCESNDSTAYFDIELEEIKKLSIREKQHDENDDDDNVPIPKFLKASELDAETIAKMDAELDAWSSDDELTIAPPPTATGFGQISAHSHGVFHIYIRTRHQHHVILITYLLSFRVLQVVERLHLSQPS